jgi:glucose-1-phosphate adenylyltransferase
VRDLPASRINVARLTHCHISDGCVVHGGTSLERCVVGVRSVIGRNVQMREVVMLGANYYEEHRPDQRPSADAPRLGIGEGSVLERCIVDKNCRVGRNVQVVNRRAVREEDGANYVIRDGIVVLPGGAVLEDGTVI